VFPDETADSIIEAAKARYGGGSAITGAAQKVTSLKATPFMERPILGVVSPHEIASALPSIGGGIGALLGGPGGAALGGAAGEAGRQLANRASGYPAPSSGVEAITQIGTQGAVQGVTEGAFKGLGILAKRAAPKLMQSAVKPSQALLAEYKTTPEVLSDTLLREGITASPRGLTKLQTLLNATNADIKAAVQASTGTVPKASVAARALPTAAKLAKQTNPTADLKAVGETVQEFMDHPVYSGPTLTVPEAQAMKQGTYRRIGERYGEQSSATVETQKALARGLKEEVAAEVPAISALNDRDSKLLAATDALGRRLALAGNRDPVGFAWVTKNPMTFLTAMADRSPLMKSLLARGLYDQAGKIAKVPPHFIRAAIAATQIEEGGEETPLNR